MLLLHTRFASHILTVCLGLHILVVITIFILIVALKDLVLKLIYAHFWRVSINKRLVSVRFSNTKLSIISILPIHIYAWYLPSVLRCSCSLIDIVTENLHLPCFRSNTHLGITVCTIQLSGDLIVRRRNMVERTTWSNFSSILSSLLRFVSHGKLGSSSIMLRVGMRCIGQQSTSLIHGRVTIWAWSVFSFNSRLLQYGVIIRRNYFFQAILPTWMPVETIVDSHPSELFKGFLAVTDTDICRWNLAVGLVKLIVVQSAILIN